MQSLKDPNTVAAIIDALRHEYTDSLARLILIEGMTLADLINSLLRVRQGPLWCHEALYRKWDRSGDRTKGHREA